LGAEWRHKEAKTLRVRSQKLVLFATLSFDDRLRRLVFVMLYGEATIPESLKGVMLKVAWPQPEDASKCSLPAQEALASIGHGRLTPTSIY
jgi:hypothetical protein